MSPIKGKRRPHTKSRNGCVPCRRRRIKCDEAGHPCANCIARGSHGECFFASRPGNGIHDQPLAPTAETSRIITDAVILDTIRSGDPSSQLGSVHRQRPQWSPSAHAHDGSLELRLMHQWGTRTSLSLVLIEEDKARWRDMTTDLAFQHGFLLDMIFSLSSLQLAYEQTDKHIACEFVSTALEYHSRAVAGVLACTAADPAGDEVLAVYCFSILNIPFSLVSPLLPVSPDEKPQSARDSILAAFSNMAIVVGVVAEHKASIDESLFGADHDPYSHPTLDASFAVPLHRLRDLVKAELTTYGDTEDDARRQSAFDDAIKLLFNALEKDITLILAFLAHASTTFVDDLRDGHPLALLIIMHWGLIVREMDPVWWARFVGTTIVDELSAELIRRKLDPDWTSSIEWCRSRVGLCRIPT